MRLRRTSFGRDTAAALIGTAVAGVICFVAFRSPSLWIPPTLAFGCGMAYLLWKDWPHALKHRRAQEGRCLACGYDRTGLPQAAPCPECGEGKGENR